jgi:hypothetical protein
MIFVKLGTIKIRAGQKDSNFIIIYLNKYTGCLAKILEPNNSVIFQRIFVKFQMQIF